MRRTARARAGRRRRGGAAVAPASHAGSGRPPRGGRAAGRPATVSTAAASRAERGRTTAAHERQHASARRSQPSASEAVRSERASRYTPVARFAAGPRRLLSGRLRWSALCTDHEGTAVSTIARPAPDFRSPYRHGFLRVAAATLRTAIGDPAANAASVLAAARECAEEGVGLVVFPELDAHRLLDRGHPPAGHAARRGRGGAGRGRRRRRPTCCRCWSSGCRCGTVTASTTWRRSCTVGGCWAWRPSRTCRPTGSSTSAARSRRATTCAARSALRGRRGAVRARPAVRRRGRARASSCTSRCARTCGCRCRRARRRRWPGATVLANLSGSPITIGRAESRCLLARSASARCLAAYVYAAAGEGESSTDLAWDGQTMIWENGVLLADTERFPKGPRHSVADVDLDLLRAERLRMGTFDDNRRTYADRTDALPHGRVPARPARRRPGAAPRGRAVPVRARRPVAAGAGLLRGLQHPGRPGLEQRMRAIGHPKLVIGVSGGLDSTHALIVAARAMDREGRPRSDILGFTLPGFATGTRTKGNALRLMQALGVTYEELDITETARLMLKNLGHPFSAGEPVYDITFENVQAGLRTDYLFRAANQRGGIVLGTGDLSELALGWCTYGVGDQMSHYNVNGGVPKTLIQHLIRWVANVEAVRRRGQRGAARRPRHRDHPRARADRRGRGGAEQRGEGRARTRCRTSPSSTSCARASGRARSRSSPGTPGATRRRATGRRDSRSTSARRTRSRRSSTGSRCSRSASTSSASSSARRCRTGRRSATAGRSRRAATGARHRTCRRGSGWTRSAPRCPTPDT